MGARPQLVQAMSRSFGTNCSARPIVSATYVLEEAQWTVVS